MSEEGASCRIDVWLWRARFFKSRALAARIVEDGGVRLARGTARSTLEKSSRQVRIGDVLSFPQGNRRIALRVEGLGERRGPACEARALFFLIDYEGPKSEPAAWETRDGADGWSRTRLEAPDERTSPRNR
jgi:ribosome-associated heat shock protein Hsp15